MGRIATLWWFMPRPDMDAGARGITGFLIEQEMTGYPTSNHFDTLGMRGSNTAALIFEDVEVPFENVLGDEGGGVACARCRVWTMSGLCYRHRHRHYGGLSGRGHALHGGAQPVRATHWQFHLDAGKIADLSTSINSSSAYLY